MIADQRTGKNSGPELADYRNGAFTIPLFCIFWPILNNISDRQTFGKNRGKGLADFRYSPDVHFSACF
jgi:hypothetical protein